MFQPNWIIQKKRDGKELSSVEISKFISGLLDGTVKDYQATAFLMAVFFQGMTLEETVALTESMLSSGERYQFPEYGPICVDKHSTGGVGDKVSLILAPLAAACGLRVPMMSGRGLGHSGGTLDKLESIPGFQTQIPKEKALRQLKDLGWFMIGQSSKMVPADRLLYSLRDVTGTVECVPLITSSILSKKIAEGANGLILDVKVGSGAFMKTLSSARKLASTLVRVSTKLGLPCRALLTDMSQPLGYAVGNSLEVDECLEVLKGQKTHNGFASADLKELTIRLCAEMLEVSGLVKNITAGRKLALNKLKDGSAYRQFCALTEAQGGDLHRFETSKHSKALFITSWKAPRNGFLSKMNTETIGRILVELGGGRKRAEDAVHPHVGLQFHKKLGASVRENEPLVQVFAQSEQGLSELESEFERAIQITPTRKPVPKLILDQIQ